MNILVGPNLKNAVLESRLLQIPLGSWLFRVRLLIRTPAENVALDLDRGHHGKQIVPDDDICDGQAQVSD